MPGSAGGAKQIPMRSIFQGKPHPFHCNVLEDARMQNGPAPETSYGTEVSHDYGHACLQQPLRLPGIQALHKFKPEARANFLVLPPRENPRQIQVAPQTCCCPSSVRAWCHHLPPLFLASFGRECRKHCRRLRSWFLLEKGVTQNLRSGGSPSRVQGKQRN